MNFQFASSPEPVITLQGDIDESLTLVTDEIISATSQSNATIKFDMADINKINSIGCMAWIKLIGRIPADRSYVFSNCPPVFIQYVNLSREILGRGKVSSFYVPYECNQCGHAWNVTNIDLSLPDEVEDFPDQSCPKCTQVTQSVEEAEDYLLFQEELG